ncbi:MAG TPA: hypothetical protein VGG39_04070 [Polyangiaceae bacterium]|jgi:hypothetical protein
MKRGADRAAGAVAAAVALSAPLAHAGPEVALRAFASEATQSGVRSLGMGGDGATTGNFARMADVAGSARLDSGIARYVDTGDAASFLAATFTTPAFWGGATLSISALSQRTTDARVWDDTPATKLEPPSLADGSNQEAFAVLAKPLSSTVSLGLMLSYAQSQMTLLPLSGTPPIRYETSWLPSGGAGLLWRPSWRWELGARVTLLDDQETRDDSSGLRTGLLREYDARLGGGWSPWRGTRIDAGFVARTQGSAVDDSLRLPSTSFKVFPTVGVEQALVRSRVWARAGLDERSATTGLSFHARPIVVDVAYVYDLALARIDDVFGRRDASLLASIRFDYR